MDRRCLHGHPVIQGSKVCPGPWGTSPTTDGLNYTQPQVKNREKEGLEESAGDAWSKQVGRGVSLVFAACYHKYSPRARCLVQLAGPALPCPRFPPASAAARGRRETGGPEP